MWLKGLSKVWTVEKAYHHQEISADIILYTYYTYCIHIQHINFDILYYCKGEKLKIFHKEGKILTNVGVLGMMLLKNVWFSHLFKLYSKTGKSQCLTF